MRSVGVFLEFCLQLLFFSKKPAPPSATRASAAKSRPLRPPRLRSKRPRRSSAALCAVMVLSAIAQFLKRVCILVIGLFRLTYRKVRLLATIGNSWSVIGTRGSVLDFSMGWTFQLMHTRLQSCMHACCRLQNISQCVTTTALSRLSPRQDCVGQVDVVVSLCTSVLIYYLVCRLSSPKDHGT